MPHPARSQVCRERASVACPNRFLDLHGRDRGQSVALGDVPLLSGISSVARSRPRDERHNICEFIGLLWDRPLRCGALKNAVDFLGIEAFLEPRAIPES